MTTEIHSRPMTPSALYERAKRRLSHTTLSSPTLLPKMPKFLEQRLHSDSISGNSSGTHSPKHPNFVNSLMPPTHRENTALHALIDTLPSMPSLSSLSAPSFLRSSKLEVSPSTNDIDALDQTSLADPLKSLDGDVVILGGYRGSILRDAKTGKRLWIPLKVGLGWRKPDLYLGLDDHDEDHAKDTVRADKMLMAVGGWLDLGLRLKNKFKAMDAAEQISFHNYGYDWRLSLERSSAELVEYLEQLKAESAARGQGVDGQGIGATVIVHSMGGLVALHALARAKDPTIFRRLICAGTPFKGCVNALGPLKLGNGVLWNQEICSPKVVFSMRSTFYFLPSSGEGFETPEGTSIPLDFYNPSTWSNYNLSPMTAGLLSPSSPSDVDREALKASGEEAARDGGVEASLGIGGVGAPEMGGAGGGGGGEEDFLGSGSECEVEVEVEGAVGAERMRRGERHEGGKVETPPSETALATYLARTLTRAKAFHQEIIDLYDPAKAHLYPPIALITSSLTPTVRGVLTESEAAIPTSMYQHLLFGSGDGIVLHDSSSQLPGRWGEHCKGVVESTHGHVSLLGDLGSVRKCLALVE